MATTDPRSSRRFGIPPHLHPFAWALLGIAVCFVGMKVWESIRQPVGDGANEPHAVAAKFMPKTVQYHGGETSPTVLSPEALYAQSLPAVGKITAKNENGSPIAHGSGFVLNDRWLHSRVADYESHQSLAELTKTLTNGQKIHQRAYIATNFHVIEAAANAEVVLGNGTTCVVVKVVAEDEEADLAILFILAESDQHVASLDLAADDPKIGTAVIAIGNPGEFSNSLSNGLVSGRRDGESAGVRWLQITAPISGGSSGGPLFTHDGKVVGITAMTHPNGQNLNLAVAASTIHRFLNRPFVSRELWRGVSTLEEEKDALITIFSRIKPDQSRNSTTIRSFVNAYRGDDSQQMIDTARSAIGVLREEDRYFAHFAIGKGLYHLAVNRLSEDPTIRPVNMSNLAQVFRSLPEAQDSIRALRTAQELKPAFAAAHHWVAVWHDLAGEPTESLHATDVQLILTPRCASGHWFRGKLLADLSRHREALAALETAETLDSSNPDIYFRIGLARQGIGEWDRAAHAYETAITQKHMTPKHCYFNLGTVRHAGGKYVQAITAFENAKVHGWPAEECDQLIARSAIKLGQ